MKDINVYEQYFHAKCFYNDCERKAAIVMLQSTYDEGNISYSVNVNFFPFRDPEDFAVTYDAFFSREIYSAQGRRSKKREAAFMEDFRSICDELAASVGGEIFWDQPLREPRYG